MGETEKSIIGNREEPIPRAESIAGKGNGLAGEATDNADTNSGSNDSNNSQTGKKKRGRPKKSPAENLEWVAEKPEVVEIPISEDIPKPKRGRPAKGKKLLETKENLLQIFSIASVFAGEIWQIDEREAEMIAKPLDSILSRYNLLEKTEKYGDAVSLVLAATAVFLPRVIFTINAKREQKAEKRKEIEEIGNQKGQIVPSDKPITTRPASPPATHTKDLLYSLPV